MVLLYETQKGDNIMRNAGICKSCKQPIYVEDDEVLDGPFHPECRLATENYINE